LIVAGFLDRCGLALEEVHHSCYKKQYDEYAKDHAGQFNGDDSNAAETTDCRNQGDYQERYCILKHDFSPFGLLSFID
jgi:hypothetical protein